METLLVLAATDADGSLARSGLEALAAARTLAAALPGATLALGLVGSVTDAAVRQAGAAGVARVFAAVAPELAAARYATDVLAGEAVVRAAAATLVLAPGTSRLNRCLPGVAARLRGRADTHVTAVAVSDGAITASRWYYRQRIEGVLTRTQRPWILLIDPGSQPPAAVDEVASGSAATEAAVAFVPVTFPVSATRTTVVGFREPAADAQTIRPDSPLLLVAGAGWTKKQADGQTHVPEAEQLILGFLRATRASLGSSKSLVDLGGEGQAILSFLSHLNQIGQTGSTPRHRKGLSTCCHGEEPHTVGWRFVAERRAISLDPNCGWARGKADVLYVADAFAVMKRVNELVATTP